MKAGSLIGLSFGLLWWLAGAGAVTGDLGTILQILGVLIFAVSGIWIIRRKPQPVSATPRWIYYLAAVFIEVVAIMLAQYWLKVKGLQQLLPSVVGLIVGLHFIGLWPAFGRLRFLVLANDGGDQPIGLTFTAHARH